MTSGKRSRANRTLLIQDDPDTAPDGQVNAARIRAQANQDGVCPACGAVFQMEWITPGKVGQATMQHEDDCPCLLDPPGLKDAMRDALGDLT